MAYLNYHRLVNRVWSKGRDSIRPYTSRLRPNIQDLWCECFVLEPTKNGVYFVGSTSVAARCNYRHISKTCKTQTTFTQDRTNLKLDWNASIVACLYQILGCLSVYMTICLVRGPSTRPVPWFSTGMSDLQVWLPAQSLGVPVPL